MPPKKQEEDNTAPYIVWNVLPVFCGAQSAIDSLKKPINIKKTIQLAKVIEILKEKGIDKYLQEGVLSDEGYVFACQNLQQASADYLAQLRKPADPKKDPKKDAKKDSKKQEIPVEEAEKTIQFVFEKSITQFLVFLDFPKDTKTLKTSLESGWKVDVIVWVEEQVKESSRLPNYDLLNRQRSIDDFLQEMNSTSSKPKEESHHRASHEEKDKKMELINAIRKLRALKVGDLQNTIIIEIPYLIDLQHPQNDSAQFLSSFFKRLCELSLNKTRFEAWKKEQQIVGMVPTIKQKVKKEVVVQEKKEDKKGGKKDPNQPPQIEIIEEIVEKRYEDMPGNAKSHLEHFKKINKNRKNVGANIYENILHNLALSISEQTERQVQVEKTSIFDYGASFLEQQKQNPANKVTIQSLANRLPKILTSQQNSFLRHQSHLHSKTTLAPQVGLVALLKHSPLNRSLQFEYKMNLFGKTMQELQTKISYNFSNRVYAEKLSPEALNSRINLQLEHSPKIYLSDNTIDQFQLLILAKTNPPGRVFYENSIFNWKVLPNFQFWEKNFKGVEHKGNFWSYDWRNAGNLKVLTKKLMPTDNMIITESVYVTGDSEQKFFSLQKDEIGYQLKPANGGFVFSKQAQGLQLDAFSSHNIEANTNNIHLSIRKNEFTILFEESPTIFWKNHPFEEKRHFGAQAQVIKYHKNGSIHVLYPNGNSSFYHFGEWKHIRNNKRIEAAQQVDMRVVTRTDGDKKVAVREDETTFVDFSNGDHLIVFRDGTKFMHFASNKTIEILNECGLVVRKTQPRSKDFNVIGTGSAFAFLGQKNILERSYDGNLYQLHHSTFTWHSYTECVDREGKLAHQPVKIVTFRDGSLLKVNHSGLITFLNGTDSKDQGILHERWLQLFTNPEYHSEGVYDVDLLQGTISTKDKESNIFKLSLRGEDDVRIAVSFNISSSKEDSNTYGNGYHVPQQNYFLPPPQNYVIPRLFIVYADGSGEQFFSEEQVNELKGFKKNKITAVSGQNFLQLIKENHDPNNFYANSFTKSINTAKYQLPALLSEQSKKVNLIPSHFHNIIFRNLEEITWDRNLENLSLATKSILEQRRKYKDELQRLRAKE